MEKNAALKVGLVTLAALLALAGIITWKSNFFARAEGYKIFGTFENVGGLLEGSEVRYRGFTVGTVEKVDPGVDKAIVTLLVKKNIKIPMGSYLRIAYDGLIGQKYLDVMPAANPQSGQVYAANATLEGRSASGLVDFIDVGTANLDELKKIVTTIREFITSPQVKVAAYQIIDNIQNTSSSLRKLVTEVQNLSSQEQGTIKEFIDNFRDISEKLKLISDNMAGFLGDPQTAVDFKATLANLKQFSTKLDNIMTQAEAALGDKKFVEDLKGAVAATKELISSTNNIVTKISDTKFRGEADLLIGKDSRDVKFRANLNITQNKGRRQFKLGLGKENQEIKLTDLQYGVRFDKMLGTRVGIFNSEPAVGVDSYLFNDRFVISSDLYDPDNLKVDVRGVLGFNDNLGMYLWAENVAHSNLRKYYLGVKVSP